MGRRVYCGANDPLGTWTGPRSFLVLTETVSRSFWSEFPSSQGVLVKQELEPTGNLSESPRKFYIYGPGSVKVVV